MLVLIALLATSPPVQRPHTEAPTLALRWTTPSEGECPSRAALLERIASLGAGPDRIGVWVPERHLEAELAVEVEVSLAPAPDAAARGQAGWIAELALTDADGRSTRSFRASSCAALAEATALIVAVTLDPVTVAEQHASVVRASPEPPTPAPPQPAPPEPASSEPSAAAEPSEGSEAAINLDLTIDEGLEPRASWPAGLQLGVALVGGGGWGPAPALAGLVGGRLAIRGARWRAELGARWLTPRRIESEAGAASVDAWLVEARGCWAPRVGSRGRIELPLCPGVELGQVRARGVAPTPSPSEGAFWTLAPSLSQGLAWAPRDRLALGLELGVAAPLTRGRFVIDGAADGATVAALAPVAGRALVIVELRLP